VFEGYRWYDRQKIAPAFPFGFGLSHAHFRFGELSVEAGPGPTGQGK
jgi:beta-glucosidase